MKTTTIAKRHVLAAFGVAMTLGVVGISWQSIRSSRSAAQNSSAKLAQPIGGSGLHANHNVDRSQTTEERVPTEGNRSYADGPLSEEEGAELGQGAIGTKAFDYAGALDDLAETFMTDEPQVRQLMKLLSDLASEMEVDEESVVVDPGWGTISGRLVLPHSEFSMSFRVDDERCLVKHSLTFSDANEFVARDVDLVFARRPTEPGVTVSVQNHPRTNYRPDRILQEGEEKCVGWSVSVGQGGAKLQPLSMSMDEGGGWRLGHAIQTEPREDPSIWSVDLHTRWRSLLDARLAETEK